MEAYWSYLARLADQQLLRSPRRLTDAAGRVICCSGESLTANQLELIYNAYRLSDIEEIIVFSGTLHRQWLFDSIKVMIDSDPSLASFHQKPIHDPLLEAACNKLYGNTALIFRLGVLHRCSPEIFKRSLFCGWIGLLLFTYMEREEGDVDTMFEASISHDIGMLDLPLDVVEEGHDAQRRHSHEYYQHAQLGADFMRNTGKSSDQVYHALCQHHETIDGSGFPHGLCGMRLNEFGQIINMFDSLYMIYTSKFKPAGRGIADLVPIVEMNSVTRFGYSAKQLIELLKTGKRTRHISAEPEQIERAVQAMRSLFVYVDHANFIIQQFTNRVGFRHEEKGLSALQNGFFHIALTIHKSPYINDEFVLRMASADATQQARHYDEIEDAALMMQEVVFHILEFKKQLTDYVQTCKTASVRAIAEETLGQLEANLLEDA